MDNHRSRGGRGQGGVLGRRPLLAVTTLYALLAALLLSGALERLARPAKLNTGIALLACLLYWLLSLLVVFVATRWRSRRRLLLATCGAALAVVAGGEVWARADIPAPGTLGFKFVHSEQYHHAHPPGRRLFILRDDEGRAIFARTNDDGLRSTYSRAQFHEFERRVAVLGDSFTFGFLVDQEFAFPQALEGKLRARLGTPAVGVLNAGVTSYSPFIERRLFDNVVAAYRPNVVLLVLDATDVGDDHFYAGLARAEGAAGTFGPSSLWLPSGGEFGEGSALYQRFEPLVNLPRGLLGHPLVAATKPLPMGGSLEVEINGVVEKNRYFIYRHPLEKTRPYFDATFANIAATAEAAKRGGAEFVLVVAPRFQHWNPDESPENWEGREYQRKEPFQDEYLRYFDEASRSAGFQIYGLIGALRAAKQFPLCFRNDPHWNRQGHDVVAEALAQMIVERNLLSR